VTVALHGQAQGLWSFHRVWASLLVQARVAEVEQYPVFWGACVERIAELLGELVATTERELESVG
jgi:hypothetical protein